MADSEAAGTFDTYLAFVLQLPFIKKARLDAQGGRRAEARHALQAPPGPLSDARLSLETPSGTYELSCFVSEQPVHATKASYYAERIATANQSIVFAPYVGPTAARIFADARLNFIDLQGNCYLSLGEHYLAKLEKAGAPPSKPAASRALRAPAYRVLLALLVEPHAITQTTRAVAELAGGVSPQTVADLRAKLVSRGFVAKRSSDHHWTPGGFQRALELFVHGFSTTLAPSLELGRFRARESDLSELETALASGLEQLGRWAFGGGAAAERLDGYYRGERTIVYMERPPTQPLKQLGLIPDTKGRVILMRSPGPLAFKQRPREHVVHPLLVYVDLLAEEHERATDAARAIYSDYLSALEDSV